MAVVTRRVTVARDHGCRDATSCTLAVSILTSQRALSAFDYSGVSVSGDHHNDGGGSSGDGGT